MSVVASVAVNVDATKAVSQLNAVDNAAKGLSGKIGALSSGLSGFGSVIAGLGLGAFVQKIGAAGIDADRTAQRIKNLAGANGEAKQLFEIAGKAAKEFGLGTTEAEKGIADLYGRLRPSGVALKDIETTFNGVNKAALAMGLTSSDTEGVFLQLAQAMGSGKLQGDELRSIMEQLPAVGQAVAKVMGVTVSEVKKLGADGKITTDIMVKAAAELNKLKPPPPDAFKQFNAAMSDLQRELGENLLPIITPLVTALLNLVKLFGALPEPVQTLVVGLAGVAAAMVAIGAAVALLGPAFIVIAQLGPTIAGFAGAVVPMVASITAALSGLLTWVTGTLLPGLLAVFSGPAGWTVLAVAAVVAMVVLFKDPIIKFLSWLGSALRDGFQAALQLAYKAWVKPWIDLWGLLKKPVTEFFRWVGGVVEWGMKAAYAVAYQVFVQPWVNIWSGLLRAPVTSFVQWLRGAWGGIAGWFQQTIIDPLSRAWRRLADYMGSTMQKVAQFLPSVWRGAIGAIATAVNAVLRIIGNNINKIIGLVNKVISGFNRLPGPDIPLIPTLSIPEFAEGGIVSKPTLAMVGEGGQREYIIPESKMAGASAAYMAGARGKDVFNSRQAGEASTPTINITTGPVVEFDGKRYVSVDDLERAMRATADGVMSRMRTPSARIAMRGA